MIAAAAILTLEARRKRAAEEMSRAMTAQLDAVALRHRLEEEIAALDRALDSLTRDELP